MKKNQIFRLRAVLVTVAVAASLSACGGGGGSNNSVAAVDPNASALHASALQSVSALFDYVTQLIASSTSDTAQPLALGSAVLPADDTAQPR